MLPIFMNEASIMGNKIEKKRRDNKHLRGLGNATESAMTTTSLDIRFRVTEHSGIDIGSVRVWDSMGWMLELHPPLNPYTSPNYIGVAKTVDKNSFPLTIEVTDCDLHSWRFYFVELETSCAHDLRSSQH